MKITQHDYGVLNAGGDFMASSDEWIIDVDTTQETGWTRSCLVLTAKIELDLQAIIYCRIPYEAILKAIHAESARMLVNSANINNGTVGLTSFPVQEKQAASEPNPESVWWTLIMGKIALLFGFLTPVQHRTFLRQKNDSLEIGCWIDRKLNAGETFTGDVLCVKTDSSVHELLETFGDLCARHTPGRVSSERPLAWNSWDYYWSCFAEKDLDENLTVLHEAYKILPRPVEVVVLDDGWFTDMGDWFTNGRFPRGTKGLADKIKAAGFIPGLWLAPFIVHWSSKAFLRTPEILAANTQGFVSPEQWGGAPAGFVDPTSPAGEKFLFDTFQTLAEMGFRYFKLDFLHYLITQNRRVFYRNDVGRMEILRIGLKIVRRAIGEESYLLACGCPPEATIGIVDSCRISGDISTYFSTTKVQAMFLAGRYWMNRRLFTADPDFLIVRGDATANDPEFHHNPYHWKDIADAAGSRSGPIWATLSEPRVWATLVALSGGALTLSDHLGKLNPPGREILHKALELAGTQAARPLDLMENLYPSYWFREDDEKIVLGIINWSDEAVEFPLKNQEDAGIEFWTGQNVFGQSLWVPGRDARVVIWNKQ